MRTFNVFIALFCAACGGNVIVDATPPDASSGDVEVDAAGPDASLIDYCNAVCSKASAVCVIGACLDLCTLTPVLDGCPKEVAAYLGCLDQNIDVACAPPDAGISNACLVEAEAMFTCCNQLPGSVC